MVDNERMEYRSLGRSGLKVSALSFGNMTSGWNTETEQWSFESLDKCIRAGVNFIDTAEFYGFGIAETVLGRNLKQGGWDRDDLVITAKVNPKGLAGVHGLSRKHIMRSLRNSLKRTQLDNVDIIYLHRFDHEVPLEESIRAVNQLIDEDKAYYWGTSEFLPQQLVECHRICEKYGLIPPIVEQCEYNLLYRKIFEVDYVPLFDHYGMGTTVWSPLAGGLLTGKYNDGAIPDQTRFASDEWAIFKIYFAQRFSPREQILDAMQKLNVLAGELGCTQAQLALAWTLKNKDVSTAIFGASRASHCDDNLGALEVSQKLTPEILEKIEGFFQNRPDTRMNWAAQQPFPPRR
jgi:voltage-dependent potassium channel beta subunit